MIDPMDMGEAEFARYKAREQAAEVYRRNGFEAFARRVEAGFEDECGQVRRARFFFDPPERPSAGFSAAWQEEELRARRCRHS